MLIRLETEESEMTEARYRQALPKLKDAELYIEGDMVMAIHIVDPML